MIYTSILILYLCTLSYASFICHQSLTSSWFIFQMVFFDSLVRRKSPNSPEKSHKYSLSLPHLGWRRSRSDNNRVQEHGTTESNKVPLKGKNDDDNDDDSLTPRSSDIYSGDEDDYQADIDDPVTGNRIEGPGSNNSSKTELVSNHRKMRRQYASSIIGGMDLKNARPSVEMMEDEARRRDDSKDKNNTEESSRKIFNFSMPFTNPSWEKKLSSIPLIGSLSSVGSSKLPSISLKKEKSDEDKKRQDIKYKLKRQTTLSTIEESFYYKDITKLADGKFGALRKAIVPSLSDDGWGNKVFDELEGDVLIMGGYRGSILRDSKTHRRAWIPVLKAGLNIRKINLLLGPKDEDELNTEKTIYPDGMLSHIGPVDISRKLMNRLASNPKVTVHNWGYDWRLSIDLIVERLHRKLKNIYSQNGGKPIILIGHSMGGIVAHGAMLKDRKLVRGIIYAGTPLPCVNVLGPMRYNDNILLCNDLLTSEVNFMMRSSFIFLPRKDQCLFKDIKTGEHYQIDFFDPKMWVKYNLSPIVSNIRLKQEKGENVDIKQQNKFSISFDDAYDYLCRTLKRTKTFRDQLKYDPNIEYPPLAVVYGNWIPSVKYSMVDGVEDIRKGIYYNFFYGPGDGITHEKWVFPKDASYPLCGKFVSHNGHIGLLSDAKCMAEAFKAILKEERKSKGKERNVL